MPETSISLIESPIGLIELMAEQDQLVSIRICAEATRPTDETPPLRETRRQLDAWFQGRLKDFDLPLAPFKSARGEELRAAITAIPYGDSLSYGALARIAQSGPRAIGQACRRNPFPIVIPCHRVIGSNGSIGHYSGGQGIATTLWLLDHESKHR